MGEGSRLVRARTVTGDGEGLVSRAGLVLAGLQGLLTELPRSRGSLTVRPEDFDGSSVGARFYPMLYLLSRVGGARDLGNGM